MGSGSSREYNNGSSRSYSGISSSRDYYSRHGGLRPDIRGGPNYSEISSRIRSPDPSDSKTLKVKKVDLEIRGNTHAHKTDAYDVTDAEQSSSKDEKLVVRRGQEFEIKVTFNREYDENSDDLRLVFQFGRDPNTSRRTHQEFILSAQDKVKDWGGWKRSQSGNDVILSIISAVNCQVGQWKLSIDVVKKNDTGYDVFRYSHPDSIYILFNAWCREDPVYLHDEDLRQAYVLAEEGAIWRGSSDWPSRMAWNFGQCTDSVLDCCLYLLDENMGANISRGDPTAVCRKISQLVNVNDRDTGILVGNWSGKYDDGVPPTAWTGSPDIFDRFYKNKQPVKYGQCWVFSALTTTFCRALGIPARCITNFESAHDTGGNIVIESYFHSDGKPVAFLNHDSVWNFHCWNEAWMSRPDLPEGYGGWQAIDATPQETSDGVFACGPYSLVALRKGDVHLPYDGPFIFSEVNADRQYFIYRNGGKELIYIDKKSVGQNISTLDPRSGEREDITTQYKPPEGSEEERIAVERAKLHRSDPGFVNKKGDVKFSLEHKSDTFVGEELRVALVITNTSDEERTINGTVSVESVYYTGVHYKKIRDERIRDLTVPPKSEKVVEMTLQQKDYYQELTDHCYCNLSAMCSVEETKFTIIDTEPMRFRKPHLTCNAPDEVRKGQTFTVEVSFKNPLDMTLTNCELSVEGPGLQRAKVYKQSNVPANGTYTGSFELTPSKPGPRQVMASFNCTQIYSVTGDRKISVLE